MRTGNALWLYEADSDCLDFGLWGIGFLIMWTVSAVNAWWEQDFQMKPLLLPVRVWAVVLVTLLGFGSVRLVFSP